VSSLTVLKQQVWSYPRVVKLFPRIHLLQITVQTSS
jgi:hypothetical protein